MRIPSGKIDQSVYFVALDATDHVTRETGLSSFTVYRSRNGAADAVMTTPTVAEIDATNMPGVYSLLIDEDTTIGASSDSEELCIHITHAGMAPVTRTIELYRSITDRLPAALVSGRMDASVGAMAANVMTAAAAASDLTTELQTGLATEATLAIVADYLDTEVAAIKAKTDALPSDPADASDIAAAFSGVNTKLDTIDDFLDTEIAAIKAVTDKLDTAVELDGAVYRLTANALEQAPTGGGGGLDAAGVRAAIGLASANLDTQLTAIDDFLDTEIAAVKAKTDLIPSDPADASDIAGAFSTVNTKLDTIDDFLDTEVAAIKAKTDSLTFTVAGQVDANIQYVNDVAVSGTGETGSQWGPA